MFLMITITIINSISNSEAPALTLNVPLRLVFEGNKSDVQCIVHMYDKAIWDFTGGNHALLMYCRSSFLGNCNLWWHHRPSRTMWKPPRMCFGLYYLRKYLKSLKLVRKETVWIPRRAKFLESEKEGFTFWPFYQPLVGSAASREAICMCSAQLANQLHPWHRHQEMVAKKRVTPGQQTLISNLWLIKINV